jgi:hypothetical protein
MIIRHYDDLLLVQHFPFLLDHKCLDLGVNQRADLKDLQLHEAAMLAGLPQGPNIYDPTKKENVERASVIHFFFCYITMSIH